MKTITKEKVELILRYLDELKLNRNAEEIPSTNFEDLFELLFKR